VPVTPAHAAAVIPLSRWKPYFWLSPLVVGSMAPDFPYYVYLRDPIRHIGHSFWGMLLFCVPAGLVAVYAFHGFFKRPLVLLMPRAVRAKLWPHCGPFPLFPLRRLFWISALIYFGAVTHVVWDLFTHENSEVPQIGAVMMTVAGHPLHWAGLLQYGSSLLGVALVAWWSWQWYRGAPAGWAPADSEFLRRTRPAIATAIVVFAASTGTVFGLMNAFRPWNHFDLGQFIAAAFITGVDAFILALLVYAVTLRVGSATGEAGRFRLPHDLSSPFGPTLQDPEKKPLTTTGGASVPDAVASLEREIGVS
jgi:hypothetical protein